MLPFWQTTRGTGGDIIVIDEAAYISVELFKETIVPMLELTGTSLLAIRYERGWITSFVCRVF